DTPYILSNNHVLADSNNNRTGCPIVQPSLGDGGTTNNVIANLYKKVIINYSSKPDNYCDGAIAKINPGISYNKEIFKIGAITGTTKAKVGMKIKKVGRTTGYTETLIRAIHVINTSENINMGKAIYRDIIKCGSLAKHGDSGSVVLNSSNKVVGLLFSGTDTRDLIIPIETVMNYFNIHF
ncbi:MAG: trypsin-like serine protease, partial [Sarcina sp.]